MIELLKNTSETADEPDEVRINLYSLVLLASVDAMSGLDPWVERTDREITAERKMTNRLVIEGLHYSLVPLKDHAGFQEYLDDLSRTPALELRERMLAEYRKRPVKEASPSGVSEEEALESRDNYLLYLEDRYPNLKGSEPNPLRQIEIEAYRLVSNPDLMKTTIIEHLGYMWNIHLRKEWNRRREYLAGISIDAAGLTPKEFLSRHISCNRETEEYLSALIDESRDVRFLPSPHVGPYFGKIHRGDQLTIFYGEGSLKNAVEAPVNLSHMLQLFQGLGDEGRMEILNLLRERGELSSPQITELCGFSPSGASRHLKLLSALGLISESRCEGTKNMKCYHFNREAFRALAESIKGWIQ